MKRITPKITLYTRLPELSLTIQQKKSQLKKYYTRIAVFLTMSIRVSDGTTLALITISKELLQDVNIFYKGPRLCCPI